MNVITVLPKEVIPIKGLEVSTPLVALAAPRTAPAAWLSEALQMELSPNPDGLFQRAQQLAAPRKEWYESGLLLGNIEPSTIMKKVHDSNRLARIDWVLGYIDLNQFRHKAMKGILLVYAADASPELHVLLIEEINRLNSL